jgi:hypothetical protein
MRSYLIRHPWCAVLTFSLVGCFDPAKLQVDSSVSDQPSVNDAGKVDGGADVMTPPPDADTPDTVSPVDAPPADVAVDTGAPDAGAVCTRSRVFITTTNYMRGGYALGRFAPTPMLMALGDMAPDQDHAPVESQCVVYELLRGDDVLAVLDTQNLPTVARRIPLRMMGAGADGGRNLVNPYDVLGVTATKAYVAQYALPRLAVIDPTMQGEAAVRGLIDLSPVRSMMDMDASGSPEPMGFVRAGRYAFVGLQNLNNFAPVTNGTVAVVDTMSDTLYDVDGSTPGTDAIRLTGQNPSAVVTTPGGGIVVAESGSFMALDGGIETVDPMMFRASGFRVTESALGGNVGSIVMLTESRGWAVVTAMDFSQSRVVEFDLMTGTVGVTVLSAGEIGGLGRDPEGNVWVLDRSMGRAGARVFQVTAAVGGTELTTMPLSTGMYPPNGIAFIP